MNLIILNIFLFLISICLALLEIQIEGVNGWASNLPTWKYNIGGFVMTGYHLYLWLFLILVVHTSFIFIKWSWEKQCYIITFLLLVLLLEDAFWFLFNRKFKLKDYWRYPKYKCVPYFYFIIALLTIFFGLFIKNNYWFMEIIILLIIVILSYPLQVKHC